MPSDPIFGKIAVAGSFEQRMMAEIGDLKRQVRDLQQSTIQVVPVSPTTSPKEGSPSIEASSPPKLWVFVNGGWHYVALS